MIWLDMVLIYMYPLVDLVDDCNDCIMFETVMCALTVLC